MSEKPSTMKDQAMGTIAVCRGFHVHGAMRRSRRATARAQKSILGRIFAAIERWQQRSAEQEAGRFIAAHGGRLTDDIERQLTEHLSGHGFVP
jgi:hypothetical protein